MGMIVWYTICFKSGADVAAITRQKIVTVLGDNRILVAINLSRYRQEQQKSHLAPLFRHYFRHRHYNSVIAKNSHLTPLFCHVIATTILLAIATIFVIATAILLSPRTAI